MVATRVPEFSVKTYVDKHVKAREDRLKDLAKKLKHDDFVAETYVRIGIPYEALLQEVREKKQDLLVMAANGRSNLVDMILGSCAQKMFCHSPIPLLSLRGDN